MSSATRSTVELWGISNSRKSLPESFGSLETVGISAGVLRESRNGGYLNRSASGIATRKDRNSLLEAIAETLNLK
ncbi:MAG: hypothetical protein HQK67_03840 [Desulfamplus sp.]|nr:hypothetical protein [Desulfamplus sp.]